MTSSLRSRDPRPGARPDPIDGARATGAAARVPDGPEPGRGVCQGWDRLGEGCECRDPDGEAHVGSGVVGWPTGRRRRPAGIRPPWDRRAAARPTARIPAPPRPGTSAGRFAVPRGSWAGLGLEAAALGAVALVAWLALRTLDPVLVAPRIAAAGALAGGTAAALMIAVAGRASGSRRAERVAAAVACYTLVEPLAAALELPGSGLWPVVELVGLLGVVGLLVLAVRRRSPARRPVILVAGAAIACAIALAGTVDGVAPGAALPTAVGATALLAAWAGAGAAGLLALVAGVRRDRPLLRRVGLAFAVLAAAHAVSVSGVAATVPIALRLAATAALLAAAVPFLCSAYRRLRAGAGSVAAHG